MEKELPGKSLTRLQLIQVQESLILFHTRKRDESTRAEDKEHHQLRIDMHRVELSKL